MPVYKENKTLQDINVGLKNVDSRYWQTHVYQYWIPAGESLSAKVPFIMYLPNDSAGYFNNQSYSLPVNIISTNTTSTIELSQPMSKLKNGIAIYINRVFAVTTAGKPSIITFSPNTPFNVPGWYGVQMTINLTNPVKLVKNTFSTSQRIATMKTSNNGTSSSLHVKAVDDSHITFLGNLSGKQGSTAIADLSGVVGAFYYIIDKIEAY